MPDADIKSKTPEELTRELTALGLPSYRAGQV